MAEVLDLNPGVVLAMALVLTVGLSYLANRWLARLFPRKQYLALVAPGVAVHELSHAIACIVTGARIQQIQLFGADGGFVKYQPSPLPLSEAVIILAPLWGATLVVWGASELLPFGPLGWLVAAYLVTSVAVTMAPSQADLRIGAGSVVVATILFSLMNGDGGLADWLDSLFGPLIDQAAVLWLVALGVLAILTFVSGLAVRRR